MKHFITLVLLMMFATSHALDYRRLDNPEQQEAYESLTSELRCLVCQNQTIKDSNAELAGDLRRQVYEMLQQGKNKDEILRFMTDRYGEFVLYKPPFETKTGLLWIGPAVFLLLGIVAIFIYVRRKKTAIAPTISADKEEKIRSLLLDKSEKGDLF